MQELTFGEQVRIVLSRKKMTIKDLATQVEAYTGKPMSRQNMTQRLQRDNFQEQDMRMIAKILGCRFALDIMGDEDDVALEPKEVTVIERAVEAPAEKDITPENLVPERDITVGELMDMQEGDMFEPEYLPEEPISEDVTEAKEESEKKFKGFSGFRKGRVKPNPQPEEEPVQEEVQGDINPYTGKEYASNSVRMHPKRIGYVQVYDQTEHKWTDMTEWAFLGFQERKKALLGKDYEPPIYLD